MKLIIREKNKVRINKLIDWLLYFFGYTIAFVLTSSLFKSVEINSNHIVISYLVIVLLLYILNKTIKPILVTLTIPITGITLGLFYPCINIFILKLVDWGLGNTFNLTNIYATIVLTILLSVINFTIDEIIEWIIKKVKKIWTE